MLKTGIAAFFIFFVIFMSPLSRWAFTHLENRFPPLDINQINVDSFDGIILLGGALSKIESSNAEKYILAPTSGAFLKPLQ